MKIKAVASVCAGIALVASIVAVSSRLELRKQREVNAAWREPQIEVPRPASLPAVTPPDTTVAAATAPDTPISSTESFTPKPAINAPLGTQTSIEQTKEDLKDPAFRQLVLSQMRLTIQRSYPDVRQELALSEDAAKKLLDLLADDQLTRAVEGSILGGQIDIQEAERTQREFDRQLEESVRAQVGDKYPQWQAYRETRSARTQVAAMSAQLAQAEMPLTEVQKKALTTALIAERKRQAQEEKFMPQNPPGNPADPGYRTRMIEESLKRAEENNRRTLEAAAPHIDATQLATLREQMERQTSMTRMTLRAEQQRLQAPAQ